jgi:hypothetical protein
MELNVFNGWAKIIERVQVGRAFQSMMAVKGLVTCPV